VSGAGRFLALLAALAWAGPGSAAVCDSSGPANGAGAAVGIALNHYAQKVSLGASARVTALNLFTPATLPDPGTLALYEDEGGVPGRRITTSPAQAFNAGSWTVFSLDPQPLLPPGSYWVASYSQGITYLGPNAESSLGAVHAPNSAHPGHADRFEAPAGSYDSLPMNLSYCAAPDVNDALDAPGLRFLVSGTAPTPWFPQSAETWDGDDAAQATVDNGQEASLYTSVDGPGTFSFYWKAQTGGDDSRLQFHVDASSNTYAAQSFDWTQVTRAIGVGRHELQWRLIGQDSGTHHAYLDRMEWVPATPTFTVTPTVTPTATATASPTTTPTATPTGTPTNTPTATPTASPTGTSTASLTASPTASPTGTATASLTATPTDTPTVTPTTSPTGSPTGSPTISPTGSATGTPGPTATATPSPAYRSTALGRPVLGPVPLRSGQPLCLHFDAPPLSSRWKVLNPAGETVASLEFGAEREHCWRQTVAPGIYLIHGQVRTTTADWVLSQKVAIVP
jgi:hypothetical protein